MIGFLVALVLAVLVAALLFWGLSIRGPWGSFWTIFLLLLLAAWAADLWIDPQTAEYGWSGWGIAWGVAWLPIVVVLLVLGLIIAAATPSTPREEAEEAGVSEPAAEEAGAAISAWFWGLLVLLAMIIIIALL